MVEENHTCEQAGPLMRITAMPALPAAEDSA